MLIWAIEDPTHYYKMARSIQHQILQLIFIPQHFAFLKFNCILRLKIKQTWVLSKKKKKKILGFLNKAFRIHFYSSFDLDAFDFQVAVIMLER